MLRLWRILQIAVVICEPSKASIILTMQLIQTLYVWYSPQVTIHLEYAFRVTLLWSDHISTRLCSLHH